MWFCFCSVGGIAPLVRFALNVFLEITFLLPRGDLLFFDALQTFGRVVSN